MGSTTTTSSRVRMRSPPPVCPLAVSARRDLEDLIRAQGATQTHRLLHGPP